MVDEGIRAVGSTGSELEAWETWEDDDEEEDEEDEYARVVMLLGEGERWDDLVKALALREEWPYVSPFGLQLGDLRDVRNIDIN